MQRIFYSSGHSPATFWESTFDEVLLIIQGTVDKWRIERRAAWKIVEGFRGTGDMPDIIDFYTLPYDDEIVRVEKQQAESDMELYRQAQVIWSKDGK